MNAIKRFVRKKLLAYLDEEKMSKYKFSQKSSIPVSTLRDISNKEDYDLGELNILKVGLGMDKKPFELFLDDCDYTVVANKEELHLVMEYRRFTEKEKQILFGCLLAIEQQRRK